GDGAPPMHVRSLLQQLRCRTLAHSALAPESWTSAAQVASSRRMNAVNSCGEPGLAMALKRARFSFISVDWRPALMARLSVSTILGGVPAGATTPVQASSVKSG